MPRLTIRHETHYRYERAVGFGLHRLLLRPVDTHASRLIRATMTLSQQGERRWSNDALGNSVCWWTPAGEADRLSIVSELTIDRFPAPLEPFKADDPDTATPIIYRVEDRLLLAPFIQPVTEDERDIVARWIRGHQGEAGEASLAFLQRLNNAIHGEFDYEARTQHGTQSPAETLRRRTGTCRDLAWLMIETLRRLGYAARFVTGYLYSRKRLDAAAEHRGGGSTHAWCEVFLPDLGWLEFDPTNGLAESADLIRVATTRTPREAAPISGALLSDPGRSELEVSVDVRLVEREAA